MSNHRTEGIILHTLRFKDYDQIVTLFTPEKGIVKLFFKNALSSKNGKGALSAPLSQVEMIYREGQSDLFSCQEIAPIQQNLRLRNDLDKLDAAFKIIKIVHDSQMPHKPAPPLYKLLLMTLKRLETSPNCPTVAASFLLKLIRHDGLFNIDRHCSHCKVALEDLHVGAGEIFCARHAPPQSIHFTDEEGLLLEILTLCKSYSQVDHEPISDDLQRKIQQLFIELLHK